MININQNLEKTLTEQLHANGFDLVDLVSIPSRGDRMVRLMTLEEALAEFDQGREGETIGYLIQVRPNGAQSASKPAPHHAAVRHDASIDTSVASCSAIDGIYLSNGKLNFQFLIKNAELLFNAKEYQLARNIYTAILQGGEHQAKALFLMARCFEAEGEFISAQKSYEESIAYNPAIETYKNLSIILVRHGKHQESAELLERALLGRSLRKEDKFELHKAAGNCWTRIEQPEKAEKHYKLALNIDPAAEEMLVNLGALHLRQHKFDEAKRCFQDALAANPANEKAMAGLGTCLFELGEKQLAHDYLARSLEIRPNNPPAIYYLVRCAYDIKSYAAAARILREFIQVAPVNIDILFSLAGLEFQLGRFDEAKRASERILEIQPEHPGARDVMKALEQYVFCHGGQINGCRRKLAEGRGG